MSKPTEDILGAVWETVEKYYKKKGYLVTPKRWDVELIVKIIFAMAEQKEGE